ncbi:unnamed protein product, partial [marine sediment metagenome]
PDIGHHCKLRLDYEFNALSTRGGSKLPAHLVLE